MTAAIEITPNAEWYYELQGKVDEGILQLQDAGGTFLLDRLDERILKYFTKRCITKPWANHLLFGIFVSIDKNFDYRSISHIASVINTRLDNIFKALNLNEISHFNVEEHMYKYLKGEIFPEHSNDMRAKLLKTYRSLAYQTKRWMVQKLPASQQDYFEPFLFPMPSFDSREFTFARLAKEQARDTRKNETDAIVPFLPQIRAEAHLRWNQMKRLRDAFQKAIEENKKQALSLPMEFHYEEPERVGERFYFRLWDRPSFVLHHQCQFLNQVVQNARKRKAAYSEEKNHHFVEFVKAESIHDDDEADGLWFTELIEEGVLGQLGSNASKEKIEQRRAFLSLWGYGDNNSTSIPRPFHSAHKGIITSSTFVSINKDKAEGILFDVEPLYAGCTFGLLAIDILTTTGARLNELLQINNTKECIQFKKVKERLHYSFYAIPKGRDEVEEFYISKQTMEIIQNVSRMLKEHYGSETILSVPYRHERKHQFPEPKPYYFQYHHKGFIDTTIYSCIRFLMHGLRFETQDGSPVIIKTHLLRHAFATEAVQRQQMPIDIVAKILHQRDLNITRYYSAPTPSQIAESVGELQDVISSYVDVDDALLRSPEELQKELEKYSEKVGVFNKVLGGTCVTDYVCPTKMACLGCKAKIPQPEQENDLIEVIQLSKDMENRFKEMELEVEVRKAREMQKQAKIELKEIDLIKRYREEQKYEPIIKCNPFW